jgi:hypothetical protein
LILQLGKEDAKISATTVKCSDGRDLKYYLLGNRSAVELDLDDVGLLLSAPEQLLLGVADDADHLV